MALTIRQLELLGDTRLSDAARILGLHLSTLGEGDHELNFDRLSTILHGTPTAQTVGVHMRQLVVHGYAERTSSGGRGSPRYRWADPSTPEKSGAEDSTPEKSGAEDPLPLKNQGQSPPVVDDGDVDGEPPVVPLAGLDPRTAAVVEELNGCRGAVRDYLLDHVPKATRRYAYAQTVRSWLQGADISPWRLPDGSLLPEGERAGVLAAALNELAAGEEGKMKRTVGDPANLRVKINILLRQRGGHERRDADSNTRTAPAGGVGQKESRQQASRRRNGFGAVH